MIGLRYGIVQDHEQVDVAEPVFPPLGFAEQGQPLPPKGRVTIVAMKTGKIRWTHKWEGNVRTGLVSTAGNVLFAASGELPRVAREGAAKALADGSAVVAVGGGTINTVGDRTGCESGG